MSHQYLAIDLGAESGRAMLADLSGHLLKLQFIAISGDAAITKVIQMPRNLGENELEGQVECRPTSTFPSPWKR